MNQQLIGMSGDLSACKKKNNSSARYTYIVLLFVGCLISTADTLAREAGSIPLGETRLTPSVRLDYVTVDNLYRVADDEIAGTGVLLKPRLNWVADNRQLALSASYDGELASFSESGLDYDNHALQLRAQSVLSSKQRVSANVRLGKYVEPQGVGQTFGLSGADVDEQIEVNSLSASAEFSYGASNARGNLRGGFATGTVSYNNREDITDGDDYRFVRPYGIFSLRLSPDTRLLFETRFSALDFDDNRRDRNELSLLTGLGLSATGKTSGDIKVGVVKASFDQQTSDDTTELIIELGVQYKSSSHSLFDVSFDRGMETVDGSANNAGQSVFDRASITWIYDWTGRFQSVASVGLNKVDRQCSGIDSQNSTFGLELNYQFRRWLQFGLNAKQSKNSRSRDTCTVSQNVDEELDYDRSTLGLHFRATL